MLCPHHVTKPVPPASAKGQLDFYSNALHEKKKRKKEANITEAHPMLLFACVPIWQALNAPSEESSEKEKKNLEELTALRLVYLDINPYYPKVK